jgi:hypothetical protein
MNCKGYRSGYSLHHSILLEGLSKTTNMLGQLGSPEYKAEALFATVSYEVMLPQSLITHRKSKAEYVLKHHVMMFSNSMGVKIYALLTQH